MGLIAEKEASLISPPQVRQPLRRRWRGLLLRRHFRHWRRGARPAHVGPMSGRHAHGPSRCPEQDPLSISAQLGLVALAAPSWCLLSKLVVVERWKFVNSESLLLILRLILPDHRTTPRALLTITGSVISRECLREALHPFFPNTPSSATPSAPHPPRGSCTEAGLTVL